MRLPRTNSQAPLYFVKEILNRPAALSANHQAVVSLADGKLELGPWQQVIYAELDGMRPKRILIKIIGE